MRSSVFIFPADNNGLAQHVAEKRKMFAGPGRRLSKETTWKM
jgi:hypothetical protein